MHTRINRFALPVLGAIVLGGSFPAPVQAAGQDESKGAAVVYPIVYKRNSGTKTSRAAAVQSVREVLQKSGYTLISDNVASSNWKRMRLPLPQPAYPTRTSELVRFGKAVKARYVIAPKFDFHSRSIWVNLGPKTISTVTTDVAIVDTTDGKLVYQRKNVKGRSDEKENTVKIVADVLVTPIVSAVSGGPKTPHEQRAAQISVARALRDWVKRQ